MNFYKREFVNRALRLCPRQSYRIVHATATGRIRSDVLLALLNNSRVGIAEPISYIPSDLMTPSEAATAMGVSTRELRRWANRKRRPSPHYRLNRITIRYPKMLLCKWIEEMSV